MGRPLRDGRAGRGGTADVAFGQLETPLTNEGTRQLFPGFRGASGNVDRDTDASAGILADAGFTVMSFVGNHTMDRSAPAMLAFVAAAEGCGVRIVGAGENLAAAREPVIVESGDTTIGFLAYCSVLPGDTTRRKCAPASHRCARTPSMSRSTGRQAPRRASSR